MRIKYHVLYTNGFEETVDVEATESEHQVFQNVYNTAMDEGEPTRLDVQEYGDTFYSIQVMETARIKAEIIEK